MDMEFFARQLLNGLTIAVVLTLFALGLSVIYGLMGILNMAHGSFFALGAYTTVWVVEAGGSFWLSLLAAPAGVAVLGYLVYRLLVRRMKTNLVLCMLATWGLALMIQQGLVLKMGPHPRSVDGPFQGSVNLAGLDYPAYRVFVIIAGLSLLAVTIWVYMRTSVGLQVRASIMSQETASTLGIDTHRVETVSFVFGSAVGGLAGALLSPLLAITPLVGLNYLIDGFFTVLVGGTGSVLGTGAGGLVIGGGQGMLELGFSSLTAHVLILLVAMAIVSVRPRGLVHKR